MPAHQTLEQRTCCNDIQVGALLIEVAQRLHSLGLTLYLVDEYQRAPGAVLRDVCLEEDGCQQVLKRVVGREEFGILLFLKVETDEGVKLLGEEAHQSGLANLSGSPQNQGLPPFLGCPLAQVLDRSSAKHTQAICFQAQRYNVLAISKPFSNQILIKSKPYSPHFTTKSKPYSGKILSKSKPKAEGNAVISKPRGRIAGLEHQAGSGERG